MKQTIFEAFDDYQQGSSRGYRIYNANDTTLTVAYDVRADDGDLEVEVGSPGNGDGQVLTRIVRGQTQPVVSTGGKYSITVFKVVGGPVPTRGVYSASGQKT